MFLHVPDSFTAIKMPISKIIMLGLKEAVAIFQPEFNQPCENPPLEVPEQVDVDLKAPH